MPLGSGKTASGRLCAARPARSAEPGVAVPRACATTRVSASPPSRPAEPAPTRVTAGCPEAFAPPGVLHWTAPLLGARLPALHPNASRLFLRTQPGLPENAPLSPGRPSGFVLRDLWAPPGPAHLVSPLLPVPSVPLRPSRRLLPAAPAPLPRTVRPRRCRPSPVLPGGPTASRWASATPPDASWVRLAASPTPGLFPGPSRKRHLRGRALAAPFPFQLAANPSATAVPRPSVAAPPWFARTFAQVGESPAGPRGLPPGELAPMEWAFPRAVQQALPTSCSRAEPATTIYFRMRSQKQSPTIVKPLPESNFPALLTYSESPIFKMNCYCLCNTYRPTSQTPGL
nr:vegetative cell wall protein gp1-like [Microcebus murinus]